MWGGARGEAGARGTGRCRSVCSCVCINVGARGGCTDTGVGVQGVCVDVDMGVQGAFTDVGAGMGLWGCV